MKEQCCMMRNECRNVKSIKLLDYTAKVIIIIVSHDESNQAKRMKGK